MASETTVTSTAAAVADETETMATVLPPGESAVTETTTEDETMTEIETEPKDARIEETTTEIDGAEREDLVPAGETPTEIGKNHLENEITEMTGGETTTETEMEVTEEERELATRDVKGEIMMMIDVNAEEGRAEVHLLLVAAAEETRNTAARAGEKQEKVMAFHFMFAVWIQGLNAECADRLTSTDGPSTSLETSQYGLPPLQTDEPRSQEGVKQFVPPTKESIIAQREKAAAAAPAKRPMRLIEVIANDRLGGKGGSHTVNLNVQACMLIYVIQTT